LINETEKNIFSLSYLRFYLYYNVYDKLWPEKQNPETMWWYINNYTNKTMKLLSTCKASVALNKNMYTL